jgi:hypothetical protein
MLRQSSKQDLGLSRGPQNRLNSTAWAEVTINSVLTHSFASCFDDGQGFLGLAMGRGCGWRWLSNGGPAPGYSSGQAQQAITRILAETLPKGMAFEWTELTFQQEIAGNTGQSPWCRTGMPRTLD